MSTRGSIVETQKNDSVSMGAGTEGHSLKMKELEMEKKKLK